MRVQKNLGNFLSNGPILLVWVTHGKSELEGLIQKLFTDKPWATNLGFLKINIFLDFITINDFHTLDN